jgi:hypothetical protein
MTTLQYEDSGYREKQIQKQKEQFAIEFAQWLQKLTSSEIDTIDYDLYLRCNTEQLLQLYKKEIGL